MNRIYGLIVILFLSPLVVAGCVEPPPPIADRDSQLTQGNIQLSIRAGSTTKAQVLESFGSPNITTRDGSGKEVWTYQRSGQVTQSSSQAGYWTILLVGLSSNKSGFETSSRMLTLIIKFDENDVVTDFRSRASHF